MLFESAHLRVSAEYGTATLWLAFPGEPVNALDLARLRELNDALAAVEHNPFVRTLVIRSSLPAGFCAGIRPEALASLATDADRGSFAWYGQRVFERLERVPFTTVAFIDGACLGAGLELALACDHRLCVARPTTHLGFPDAPRGIPPCFGGTVRLRRLLGRRAGQLLGSGRTLSGREARGLGLVDRAFCERRAKIELRTFLDELERRPVSREREQAGDGFAAERRNFVRGLDPAAVVRQFDAAKPLPVSPLNPVPPFPRVIGVASDDESAATLVAQAVLCGGEAVVSGTGADLFRGIELARARGFVTPLEADQAKGRVEVATDFAGFDRAGLVFANALPHALADAIRPRCIVACGGAPDWFPHPRRVIAVRFGHGTVELIRFPATDPDTVATLAAWLRPFGHTATLRATTAVSARAAA
jgi:enoyl-CoA hydratase/carnithine racemase